MIRGFYAARSGVLGQQQNMNTIANNFANIGTMGYKPQQAAFSTLLYAKVYGGAARPDEENRLRPPYDHIMLDTGHGSRVEHTAVNHAQGGIATTGVPTDMAIIGDGFFAVMGGEDGEIFYTRDGQFKYSVDGDSRYLVDASGRYVLDAGGAQIALEGGAEITPAAVGVFKFPNRHGLSMMGSNRLAATEASGEAEAVERPNVKAGCLERSGVDTAAEVVRMIESQRAFSLNARVLTTIDEMDDVANQMR
ncbi:MAG: flagellar hook-basal body protein [Clostridiales Family XIII bacterium]|jgi:flagellar basal-body rod protein FlgG|nr:flagellar hook-basal body protein [Clostridiales Family XIII bacterium]